MTVALEYPHRIPAMQMAQQQQQQQPVTLEDRFEVIKDIGDGSFGSVALARVRTAGAHIAKRGTMVAIKTMKKSFDSFAPCAELREVIFLRSLPAHVHLVPALDIFLDPMSKKLHICMEYMDGNLYQLMKARDHRCLEVSSVKSILYQILSGLDHIHSNHFFHRDIKPENILISNSSSQDSSFRRYSSLVTPPATPTLYTVKIADFGLARETHSKTPYTTYVSTRWYRAPEVLLRAGEYSAPVDIWALGAMAVEVATLKPLFPGGNEVDQVWRVCDIMGSPGNWYSKTGNKMGGGEWREGIRLAQKLGFSFPKMAPHSLETILQPPQWPSSLANFVTWCLMWDPKHRPTSSQAMNHEFFLDAVDPLIRPKSSSRLLSRKSSMYDPKAKDGSESTHSNRTSWFRKSLIARDSAPAIPQQSTVANSQLVSPGPSPVRQQQLPILDPPKVRSEANKRNTWANGPGPALAPMPILPSIRPISPLSNTVNAQAQTAATAQPPPAPEAPSAAPRADKGSKKLGRQLSLASHGNHYADLAAERALNGLGSPTSASKEGFFSHLRKRARRLSGRYPSAHSPRHDEEALIGQAPANAVSDSKRSSMLIDSPPSVGPTKAHLNEVDQALLKVRQGSQPPASSEHAPPAPPKHEATPAPQAAHLKRSSSLRHSVEDASSLGGPVSSHTRRSRRVSAHPAHRYETPDEEDELLDEALNGARRAARGLINHPPPAQADQRPSPVEPRHPPRGDSHNPVSDSKALQHSMSVGAPSHNNNGYPTPSPSAKRSGGVFSGLMDRSANDRNASPARVLLDRPRSPPAAKYPDQRSSPVAIPTKARDQPLVMWPTPPYEENEWAASANASIFAAGSMYR